MQPWSEEDHVAETDGAGLPNALSYAQRLLRLAVASPPAVRAVGGLAHPDSEASAGERGECRVDLGWSRLVLPSDPSVGDVTVGGNEQHRPLTLEHSQGRGCVGAGSDEREMVSVGAVAEPVDLLWVGGVLIEQRPHRVHAMPVE